MKKTTTTYSAIVEALATGYRYDPETGVIYSKTGTPLKPHSGGQAMYPTVTFGLPMLAANLGRKHAGFAIPIHKFAAHCLFGDEAYKDGVQVRHLKTMLDIKRGDLALGTARENMSDIPANVRKRASATARATADKARSVALRKLTDTEVDAIKKRARRDSAGNLLPGELDRLASQFAVPKAIVGGVLRGIMYTPKK